MIIDDVVALLNMEKMKNFDYYVALEEDFEHDEYFAEKVVNFSLEVVLEHCY